MLDDVDLGPFEEPVSVTTDAGERLVSSAREAAEMLLYDWPIGETAIRIQARISCMKVLAGSEPPASAREAFMQAAEEAKILIQVQPGEIAALRDG
jgi:sugar/nucleoside kinase (ribokinase family)